MIKLFMHFYLNHLTILLLKIMAMMALNNQDLTVLLFYTWTIMVMVHLT